MNKELEKIAQAAFKDELAKMAEYEQNLSDEEYESALENARKTVGLFAPKRDEVGEIIGRAMFTGGVSAIPGVALNRIAQDSKILRRLGLGAAIAGGLFGAFKGAKSAADDIRDDLAIDILRRGGTY